MSPAPDPSSRGPLRAAGAPRPSAVRARNRRRRVLAVVVIVLLLALTAGVALVAFQSAGRPTEASLTPRPGTASDAPAPTASDESDVENAVTVEEVSGQTVSWIAPDGDPVGVALLLPDRGETGESLITNAAAQTLAAAGLVVVAADFGGESWGSPASTDALAAVRAWSDGEWAGLPVTYVAAGTGATTAIAAMTRDPATVATCVYTAAPVTDLVAAVGADASLAARIAAAWGRTPTPDDNPILAVPDLPLETTYRIAVPGAPDERVEDAEGFASSLTASGHTVTTTTVATASWAALADDLATFTEGCRA